MFRKTAEQLDDRESEEEGSHHAFACPQSCIGTLDGWWPIGSHVRCPYVICVLVISGSRRTMILWRRVGRSRFLGIGSDRVFRRHDPGAHRVGIHLRKFGAEKEDLSGVVHPDEDDHDGSGRTGAALPHRRAGKGRGGPEDGNRPRGRRGRRGRARA